MIHKKDNLKMNIKSLLYIHRHFLYIKRRFVFLFFKKEEEERLETIIIGYFYINILNGIEFKFLIFYNNNKFILTRIRSRR
jgi:hypothetical protein